MNSKDTAAGTGSPDSPANANPKDGKGKGTGKPDSPEANAETVSKADHDVEINKLKIEFQHDISELKKQLGQQGDELGIYRKQAATSVDLEAYAKQIYADIFESNDALKAIPALSRFMLQTHQDFENQRLDAMNAHKIVQDRNPEFKEITYQAADYYAALQGISVTEMSTNKGMQRVMDGVLTQQNANFDIEAEVDRRIAERDAGADKKHPADGKTKPGSEQPDSKHDGEPLDDKQFTKNRLNAMGAAAFQGTIEAEQ